LLQEVTTASLQEFADAHKRENVKDDHDPFVEFWFDDQEDKVSWGISISTVALMRTAENQTRCAQGDDSYKTTVGNFPYILLG
jgi:hypothetical protein